MSFLDFWEGVMAGVQQLTLLGFFGFLFGVLNVIFLIRGSIWNFPLGIAYVIVSFVIFWDARLYGDFFLHIFFLALNIYGWYYWVYGKKKDTKELLITRMSGNTLVRSLILSVVGVFVFAQLLIKIPGLFEGVEAAALPYWDSTTSMLSVTGMWLTARKKIENWYYWLVVDILATGIYFYKELYFYSLLYFIFIGMAISGYLSWKKSMQKQVLYD